MTTFADRAKSFAATAAQIARISGAVAEADVLERSSASLVETGYDNWNDGTTFFTLMLEIPVGVYVAVDSKRDELEQSILSRVSQFTRAEAGNRITAVVVSPVLTDEVRAPVPASEPGQGEEAIPSFWQPGFFRLFISHLASNKEKAHALKEALARYQVAAFVAHDDIEPTREWQGEIESALRTMDALAAIVEPGFVESRWCDQEVGVAIGRGKLILPLRAGADPHGFMGKYQGIQTKGVTVAIVAERMFEVLLANSRSSARMAEAVVERMVVSNSWEQAKRNVGLLERVPALSTPQIARLMQALDDNRQVKDAFGVPEKLRTLFQRHAKRNPA